MVNNNWLEIQDLLDDVIRNLQTFIERGTYKGSDGKALLSGLKGIRTYFFDEGNIQLGPSDIEIDIIDEWILSLDLMFLDAGLRQNQNTMRYIARTLIYAVGECHRALTNEEQEAVFVVLLKRKQRVSQYMEAIQTAADLDGKKKLYCDMKKQQMELEMRCRTYEERINYVKNMRPDILREILYYIDFEDMSEEANAYLDLQTLLDRENNHKLANQREQFYLEQVIHELELKLAGAGDNEIESLLQQYGGNNRKAVDWENADVVDLYYGVMDMTKNTEMIDSYIRKCNEEYIYYGLEDELD